MHRFFKEANASSLQQAQFRQEHLPEMAMTPREAYLRLVRNDVDFLPIDEIEGRIATTLFVIYPPGIATIVPGERLDTKARPMRRRVNFSSFCGALSVSRSPASAAS